MIDKFIHILKKSLNNYGKAIGLFIVLMMGVVVGIQFEKQQIYAGADNYYVNLMSDYNKLPSKKCKFYGYNNNPDLIYRKYTVKKGDSLISIARDQLGSSSRVADILAINKNFYPNLNLDNPSINPGWTLYLTPPYVYKMTTDGTSVKPLKMASGHIVSLDSEDTWKIYTTWENPYTYLYLNTQTEFTSKVKSDYKVGDCFTAIMPAGGNETAFRVTPQ